jgi:hypothetical protein
MGWPWNLSRDCYTQRHIEKENPQISSSIVCKEIRPNIPEMPTWSTTRLSIIDIPPQEKTSLSIQINQSKDIDAFDHQQLPPQKNASLSVQTRRTRQSKALDTFRQANDQCTAEDNLTGQDIHKKRKLKGDKTSLHKSISQLEHSSEPLSLGKFVRDINYLHD